MKYLVAAAYVAAALTLLYSTACSGSSSLPAVRPALTAGDTPGGPVSKDSTGESVNPNDSVGGGLPSKSVRKVHRLDSVGGGLPAVQINQPVDGMHKPVWSL